MRTRTLLALALVVLCGVLASAQDPTDYAAYYPTHARGHVNTMFDASGIDDINLFTGNVTLSIPLGPPLHPGGDLAFQLALHYNSSVWADDERCSGHPYVPDDPDPLCDEFGSGALLGAPDVGLGWSLEVGHIAPRFEGELFLVTPDGGEHQLFTSRFGTYDLGHSACEMPSVEDACYTRDGSDVKVVRIGTQTYRAHFPDGTTHFYTRVLDNYDEGTEPPTYVGRDYARQRDGTYCTSMEDRWGNRIAIEYHENSFDDDEHTWWEEAYNDATEPQAINTVQQLIPSTITEYRADATPLRRVEIAVVHPANHPLLSRTRPWRVSQVTFFDPDGGQFLRYNLGYLSYEYWLPRLQLMSYYPAVSVDQANRTDWVYLLESLAVEGEGLAYGFRYWTCATDLYGGCDAIPEPEDKFAISGDPFDHHKGMQLGTLRQLELPTGGVINYDYGVWQKAHHTQTPTPEPHDCDISSWILCPQPPDAPPEPDCSDKETYSLGVATRDVRDREGAPLELKSYAHTSSSNLDLRVRFDAGDLAAPNPALGDPHTSSSLPFPYVTSYSKTTVTTHYVTDPALRSDDAEHVFSLGTSVLDYDEDCGIDGGEPVTFPLSGALVYQRQYRGSGAGRTPVRTTVHTYTVDDEAWGWAGTGSRYGTQVNRRPREVITYDHGAAADDKDLVEVTRYGYESDLCSPSASSCTNLLEPSLGYTKAFPSHRTTIYSQTGFDPRTFVFSEERMFAPLDDLEDEDFDRNEQTYYWKGGDSEWLLHRPADARVDSDMEDPAEQRSTWEWSPSHGELLLERVHFEPAAPSHDKDVVTRYEYVTSILDPGVGQLRRRAVGLWQYMEGSDLDQLNPDLSEYYEYDHATPVRMWLLCQEPEQSVMPDLPLTPADAAGRCDGWQPNPILDHPAELQWERTVHAGWRLPTSSRDGSGDGVASAEYDGAGRLYYLEPTETEGTDTMLSPTWITYPTIYPWEQRVSVWDASDVVPQAQVVTRAVYDGLGRLSHLARRRALTTSSGYVEGDFRHKTYSYDGLGTLWRESDWTDTPIWSVNYSTVVERTDPFGRPEVVRRSNNSMTASTYIGPLRADVIVGVPEGETVPQARTVTDYDARGNPVRVLEEKDLTTLSDPDPGSAEDFVISQYLYDVADRLVSVRVTGEPAGDPREVVTQERSFTYDPRGFLTREGHPELGTTANDFVAYCRHDALGRPRRQMYRSTDCTEPPPDNVLDAYFDAAGRPREIWVEVGGRWYVTTRVDYGISAAGHSVGKPIVESQFTSVKPDPEDPNPDFLDPDAVRITHVNSYGGPQGLLSGRRTEVRFRPDGSRGYQKFDTGYSYDRWGNVAQIRYPELVGLSQCAEAPTVDLDWDSTAIREVQHSDTGRQLLSNVAYDPWTGMMTSWRTPAGPAGGNGWVFHNVEPDSSRPRVRRIRAQGSGPGMPVLFDTGNYTYDGLGNVLTIPGDATRSTSGWTYHYDGLSRLKDATNSAHGGLLFNMDDFGNLVPQGMTSDSVDATTNRLTGGFNYDDRGNLVHELTGLGWYRDLRFNPLNQLVAVWPFAGGETMPASAYAFAYDAAGERVLRYEVGGGSVLSATFSLRDPSGNLLTELTWTPGMWTREGDWVYAGREPMVRIENDGGSWRYVSLVTDHLGTTRVEVEDGYSSDYTKLDYWPYGDLVTTPASPIYEKHLFTAHEREFIGTQLSTATLGNLDYMHQREYTHRLGRFLSLDPVGGSVGSSQSWNRYSYVRNNPLNLIDPYGERGRRESPPCDDNTDECVRQQEEKQREEEEAEARRQALIQYLITYGEQRFGEIVWTDGQLGSEDRASLYLQMFLEDAQAGNESQEAYELFGPGIGQFWAAESRGSPLDPILFLGAASLVRGVGFNAQQSALISLAKESARKGVSRSEAATLLRWSREYGVKPALSHTRPPWHWVKGPHIRIGPVRHIPVIE